MTAKLLFLFILAITGLGVVQAGSSASWRLICPAHWFINGVREIASLPLGQSQNRMLHLARIWLRVSRKQELLSRLSELVGWQAK
jgi:hypothetical protein